MTRTKTTEATRAGRTDVGAFDEAAARARSVLCGNREGVTCHTVDPCVDELVAAHDREVADLRAEARSLRATLQGLRKIVREVSCESLNTPWVARGRCIYPSSQLADCGDLIATFEDADGVVGVETVCAVNAFMEVREHIDRFFKDKKETDDGPQG